MRQTITRVLSFCIALSMLTGICAYAGYTDDDFTYIENDEQINTVLMTDVNEPLLLKSGDDSLVRFGSSYLDKTVPTSMSFDENENPVAAARVAACSSSTYIGNCGIRHSSPFSIREENIYMAVTYWVKAVSDSDDNLPRVKGVLQYCTESGSVSGSVIEAVSGVKGEQILDNDTWYKCFQTFKVEGMGYTSGSDEFNSLRFVLNSGISGQTTYLSGVYVYDFGTDFCYNDISEPVSAIGSYIEDTKIKALSCDNVNIEGFSPDISGYTAVSENGILDRNSFHIDTNLFSRYSIEVPNQIPGMVKITTNSYRYDVINKYKDACNTKDYFVYVRLNDKVYVKESGLVKSDGSDEQNIHAGVNTCRAVIQNDGVDCNAYAAVCLFDSEKNKLIDFKLNNINLEGNKSTTADMEFTAPIEGEYYVQIFIINDTEEPYPVSDKALSYGSFYNYADASDGDITVQNDITEGNVVVSGFSGASVPHRISVFGVTEKNDISDASVVFADIITTDASGNFKISFIPGKSDNCTNFSLYIFDEILGNIAQKEFNYYSDKVISDAVKWFKTASTEAVIQALEPNGMVNGNVLSSFLFGDALDEYYKIDNKQAIAAQMSGKDFQDLASLADAFKNAVTYAKICIEFSTADMEELKELVKSYSEILAFEMDSNYGYDSLTVSQQESILSSNILNKSFLTAKELTDTFNNSIILYDINNYAWGKMENLISFFGEKLGIDIHSSKYLNLTSTQKTKLYKLLAAETYVSKEDITNKFNSKLIIAANDTSGGYAGFSGGGGGSDSNSKSSVGSVFVVNNNENNNENNQSSDKEEKAFSDMEEVFWAKEYILKLYDKKVISGDGSGKFYPNNELTRAEFVKMIVIAFNIYDEKAVTDFNDCKDGDWYCTYIASAVNKGIVSGVTDDLFCPYNKITRQDMAVISYRALQCAGKMSDYGNSYNKFDDWDTIADYACESIAAMTQAGIIDGTGDNLFSPKKLTTRAMAAKVVSMIMDL